MQPQTGEDARWYETDSKEILVIIGMWVYMSIIVLPDIKMYWSEDNLFGGFPVHKWQRILRGFRQAGIERTYGIFIRTKQTEKAWTWTIYSLILFNNSNQALYDNKRYPWVFMRVLLQ